MFLCRVWGQLSIAMSDVELLLSVCELLLCEGVQFDSCAESEAKLSITMSDVEFPLSVCELLLCEGVQFGSCAESKPSAVLRFVCLSVRCCCVKEFNLACVMFWAVFCSISNFGLYCGGQCSNALCSAGQCCVFLFCKVNSF